MCNSSVLALFASGRTRGLALEVGGGVAHAVPVFEGFALNHAVLRLEGAGQDITHRLKLLLEERGHHLPVGGAHALLNIFNCPLQYRTLFMRGSSTMNGLVLTSLLSKQDDD